MKEAILLAVRLAERMREGPGCSRADEIRGNDHTKSAFADYRLRSSACRR